MDVVQGVIDNDQAQFILTGSSARKLKRHHHMNLLPGRVVSLRLDPLTLEEHFTLSLNLSYKHCFRYKNLITYMLFFS